MQRKDNLGDDELNVAMKIVLNAHNSYQSILFHTYFLARVLG